MNPKLKDFVIDKTYKLIRKGLSCDDIVTKVLESNDFSKMLTAEKDVIAAFIKQYVDSSDNYKFVQRVGRNKVLRFLNEKGKEALYNIADNTVEKISLVAIRDMMDDDVWKKNQVAVESDYNPHKSERFYIKNSVECFNVYNPPFWKATISSQPPIKELPEIYKKFLHAFTDGDEPSIDFIIRWLAHSIRDRNITCLCAIGNKGIGKQLFGDVLAALHGEQNYKHIRGGTIDNKFNAHLKNRTLTYLDECEIKTKEQEEAFKMLVNKRIEIEAKGFDSDTHDNYINFYLSSNTLKAMRITPDERRFSVINVRSTNLIFAEGFDDPKKYGEEMCKSENIQQLANYLWNLEYDPKAQDLIIGFKSKRFNEVFNAGFTRWQSHFINVYCKENAGKTLQYQEVNKALALQTDTKVNPSVSTWNDFHKRIKSRWESEGDKQTFKVRRATTAPHYTLIEIAPLEEQSEILIDEQESE